MRRQFVSLMGVFRRVQYASPSTNIIIVPVSSESTTAECARAPRSRQESYCLRPSWTLDIGQFRSSLVRQFRVIPIRVLISSPPPVSCLCCECLPSCRYAFMFVTNVRLNMLVKVIALFVQSYFDKSQLHMFGGLLDEEHRHNWWEFEAVPYEEAIRQPHGRFLASAVRLPWRE